MLLVLLLQQFIYLFQVEFINIVLDVAVVDLFYLEICMSKGLL